MSLSKSLKIIFRYTLISICFSTLLFGLLLKPLIISPLENRPTASAGDLKGEELKCEKVGKNVMENRKKEFTSKVNPSHSWIEEYLEIISENKTICQGINKVNTSNVKLLVIIVNSKMDHFRERQVIRDSYGLIREHKSENVKWHVRTAFLVAQSSDCMSRWKNQTTWMDTKLKENQIDSEQKNHGDLIIGSFMDTYRNNTYKHLMGYKFVLERCPQADLIVKTDDDVFVNVPEIINLRMEEIKGNKTGNDIYCPFLRKRIPDREKVARYFVKEEEWPVDSYPDFCAGAFMVISFEWVKMLYSVRNLGGFFWIDDTHVSGRLREIAEQEFGVKANFKDITKWVWWVSLKISKVCGGVTPENFGAKRKMVPMFAQLKRDEMMGENMRCLTDLSVGINISVEL